MATLPGATYSAPGQPLYQPFGSGQVNLSTISVADTYIWEGVTYSTNTVEFHLAAESTSQLSLQTAGLYSALTLDGATGDLEIYTAGSVNIPTPLNVSTLSTGFIDTDTISTSKIDLDGQVLTADANDLLLNGIPVATISSLSSIADWALDPAISTVQMAGNWLVDVPRIQGYNSSLLMNVGNVNLTAVEDAVSSQFIFDTGAGPLMRYRAGNLDVSSITASNVTAVTFTALSSISVVSTISSLIEEAQLGNFSTLVAGNISTPALVVSSINGAEFTSTQITVQVAGVSSLVANSISSIGAELRTALVSTLQFNPSFSPNLDVNLGLGSLFGNLAGAASGALGVLVGGAALGTGIAALSQSRQTNYINSNAYELVNGTTQIQISSLGTSFSTVYRFVSSVSENVPGAEYFVSSIHAPGVAIRSVSDPLNTVSSPNSTIQSFGQWVALDANLPIPSTVSSFQQLFTSSLAASTVVAQNGIGVRGGAPYFNSPSGVSTLEVYEVAAGQYSGALRANQINFSYAGLTSNDFTQDTLLFNSGGNRLTTGGGRTIAYLSDIPAGFSTVSTFQTASISSATISSVNGGIPYTTANPPPAAPTVSTFNQLFTSSATVSTLSVVGVSTINISTSTAVGAQGQPSGRLVIDGNDLDMRQNDIWAQQIRLGAGNATNAQTEIIFYDASAGVRGLNTALQDRTLRVISTVNGNTGGYLLDTALNPPFFSTIGGNVNLMAFFPSTTNSTIGASTLSVFPTSTAANASTIAVSSITSIGSVSSIVVVPNASSFMSMTTVGDVDFVTRDFFAQAITGGVVKATLAVNSSGAGGNGLFALGADVGVGTLYASSITFSTNQTTLRGVPIPQQQYGRGTLSGGTQTIVLPTPYADSNEYSVLLTYKDTAGGNPLHANILSISSFSANGTGTNDFFWQTIGRV